MSGRFTFTLKSSATSLTSISFSGFELIEALGFILIKAKTTETKLGKVGDTANFGISLLGANGWGYKIQNRRKQKSA